MSDASKREEKQKWTIEKLKLDNARKSRGIYFIDPEDEEFKDIMKNSQRKLEIPMPAAMHCKLQRCPYRETCCALREHKTKYACIVEADDTMRIRMEGAHHRDHEDYIAGKGTNSQIFPMPQEMKFPDAKAAVEKELENSRKYRHGS